MQRRCHQWRMGSFERRSGAGPHGEGYNSANQAAREQGRAAIKAGQRGSFTFAMLNDTVTNCETIQTVCIVLTGVGGSNEADCEPIEPSLQSALDQRRWRAVTVSDPVAAMAEAALHERSQQSRSEWGLPRTERTSLLLGKAIADEERNELIRALKKYLPGVDLWLSRGGAIERMTSPEQDRLCAPRGAKPTGRIAERRRENGSDSKREGDEQIVSVTRDEINMLLERVGRSES
jgi:hypothetical protein